MGPVQFYGEWTGWGPIGLSDRGDTFTPLLMRVKYPRERYVSMCPRLNERRSGEATEGCLIGYPRLGR